MPVYDYKCQKHGLFHDLATLEESGDPMPCPTCREPCARVIIISPSLQCINEKQREIIERNEKAANEPMSLEQYRNTHTSDKCSEIKISIGKSKLIYTADGNKMFPSMRPWMISH